jgi:hypothetical protein
VDEPVVETRCPWCSHPVAEGDTSCAACGASWGGRQPVERKRRAGWRALLIAAVCILPIGVYLNWSSQAAHFRDDCRAGALSGDQAMTAAERSAQVHWVIDQSGPHFTCKAVDRTGRTVASSSRWILGG